MALFGKLQLLFEKCNIKEQNKAIDTTWFRKKTLPATYRNLVPYTALDKLEMRKYAPIIR